MAHCRFCAHLKMSNNTQILAPFLPKIMDGLLTMATQSTDDVLALVLESLRIVMSVRWLLLQPRSQAFFLRNSEALEKPWERGRCCSWWAPVVTDPHKPSRKCRGREQWLWKMWLETSQLPTISLLPNPPPPQLYFPQSFLARLFFFSFLPSTFHCTNILIWFTRPLSIRSNGYYILVNRSLWFISRSIKNLQRLAKEEYHRWQ